MSNIMTIEEWRKHNVKRHAKKTKSGSANALTKRILAELNARGYIAWRNNTMGVFDSKRAGGLIFKQKHTIKSVKDAINLLVKCYRKSHERKGVSDIIGYQKKTARFIAVEVKYGKDKLSVEQQYFLEQVNKDGGISIEARSFEQFINELEKVEG